MFSKHISKSLALPTSSCKLRVSEIILRNWHCQNCSNLLLLSLSLTVPVTEDLSRMAENKKSA